VLGFGGGGGGAGEREDKGRQEICKTSWEPNSRETAKAIICWETMTRPNGSLDRPHPQEERDEAHLNRAESNYRRSEKKSNPLSRPTPRTGRRVRDIYELGKGEGAPRMNTAVKKVKGRGAFFTSQRSVDSSSHCTEWGGGKGVENSSERRT